MKCRSCDFEAEDYGDLARHVALSKKGHQKGKKWAASYLLKVRWLNGKKDKPERIPLTGEERDVIRESKKSTTRELSGENKTGKVICPKCGQSHVATIPVEYVESRDAWRLAGMLAIMCDSCGTRR